MVQIFKIMKDGEVHEITDEDRPIKEFLDSSECFLINDDDARVVYLWKGKNSPVRSKFIGAQKLQEMRGQVGLNYSTVSMDEDEMEDHPQFMAIIEEVRSDGYAKEIREDQELPFEVESGPVQTRTYQSIMARTASGQYNQQIEQTGPLYRGEDGVEYSSQAGSVVQEFTKKELDEILEILDKEGIPEGYEREMIIMGPKAYSVAEKVQTFLGKKQVEKVLEPISTLPEGIFFAEGYVPRVLVDKQKVVAVEFLKKKE